MMRDNERNNHNTYPFTPVAAMPPTTYFGRHANRIIIGIIDMIDEAKIAG